MYYFVMLSPAFVTTDLRRAKWRVRGVREGWVFSSYLSLYGGQPLFYNFLSQSVDRDFKKKTNIKKVEDCNVVTSSSLSNHCYSLILW